MKAKNKIQSKRAANREEIEPYAKRKKRLLGIQHAVVASIPDIQEEIHEFAQSVATRSLCILGLVFEYLGSFMEDDHLQPDLFFFGNYKDFGLNLVSLSGMLELASKTMLLDNASFRNHAQDCFSEEPDLEKQQKRFEELLVNWRKEYKK